MKEVVDMVKEKLNISCELIDLRTILPWDTETVCNVIINFHFFKKFKLTCLILSLFVKLEDY